MEECNTSFYILTTNSQQIAQGKMTARGCLIEKSVTNPVKLAKACYWGSIGLLKICMLLSKTVESVVKLKSMDFSEQLSRICSLLATRFMIKVEPLKAPA